MDWKDLSGLVGKAAPILGTLLGGPAGAAVGSIIASALGTGGTPDDVSAAIAADPAALVKLREIEASKQVRLQELAADQAKAELATAAADRDSARTMQTATRSNMPAVLTSGVGLVFAFTLSALFWMPIPAENRDVIVYMCGQLAAAFAATLAFWFGTTRSSADKTALLAQAQPVPK